MAAKAPDCPSAFKGDFYFEKCASPLCSELQVSRIFDARAFSVHMCVFVIRSKASPASSVWQRRKSWDDWKTNFCVIRQTFLPTQLFQYAGGIMDGSGCGRESAVERSGSPRREEPSAGGRPEPLVTCALERYRTAKFSLAAYLLCWVVLRWYQVRSTAAEHFDHKVKTENLETWVQEIRNYEGDAVCNSINHIGIKLLQMWGMVNSEVSCTPSDHNNDDNEILLILRIPPCLRLNTFCTQAHSFNFLNWLCGLLLLMWLLWFLLCWGLVLLNILLKHVYEARCSDAGFELWGGKKSQSHKKEILFG